MRIAGIIPESIVDGEGLRYTIFFQGCKHHCKGCHNPETWDLNGGYEMSIEELIQDIKENSDLIEGITLSGGDPFVQQELLSFLQMFRKEFNNLNVWAYTGYHFETLLEKPIFKQCLEYIDVLVDAPFVLSKRSTALKFKGSSNQRIIDVRKSLETNNVHLYKC